MEHCGKKLIAAVVCALLAVMLIVVLAAGCGESIQDKQKEYVKDYVDIINAFQAKVTKDDAKAAELTKTNDIAGAIKLNLDRVKSINATFDQLAALVPPGDLRRVQAETLYYLVALIDQLQSQSTYFEAVLSGKPSNDLKSIAESSVARAQQVGSELALDLQKTNISIKSAPAVPTQTQPQSPSTSPGASSP